MKRFDFISFIMALTLLLSITTYSCGGDYELELDENYFLVKLDSDNHSIINREHIFYNYVKKGVQLEECLELHSKGYCQGIGSDTIVEPNILKIGVHDKYIVGLKKNLNGNNSKHYSHQGLIPLQLDGYFLINKEMVTVETGLTEADFLNRVDDLGIKGALKEIDDRTNMIKAIPQMFINEKFGY